MSYPIFPDVDDITGLHDAEADADNSCHSNLLMEIATAENTLYEHLADFPVSPSQAQQVDGHDHSKGDSSEHIEREMFVNVGTIPFHSNNFDVVDRSDPGGVDTDQSIYTCKGMALGFTSGSPNPGSWAMYVTAVRICFYIHKDIDTVYGPSVILLPNGNYGNACCRLYQDDGTEIDSDWLSGSGGASDPGTNSNTQYQFILDTSGSSYSGWCYMTLYLWRCSGSGYIYLAGDDRWLNITGLTTNRLSNVGQMAT